MANVKESKELLIFLGLFGTAIGKSFSNNGKIDLFDFTNFIGAMGASGEALAGSKKIPAELADLDDAERKELVKAFEEALTLAPSQKNIEELVEKGLKAGVFLTEFFSALRGE